MIVYKLKKKTIFKNSGFSLIEILLAMAILFIIVGGVITFSVRTIESHTKNQAMQNAMDNTRFAIEGMSKKIRTSSGINQDDSNEIFFIDNVGGKRYCYNFNADVLRVKTSDDAGHSKCDDIPDGNFADLVGGGNLNVTGAFNLKETDDAEVTPNKKRGFVRIRVTIEDDGNGDVAKQDKVIIQSGVSLRDYMDNN